MTTVNDLLRNDLKEYTLYAAGGMQVKPAPGKEIVKLNANEMQMGPSPKAIEAMTAELTNGHLYPMETIARLKKRLSEYTGKDMDCITIFAGAGGAIQALGEAFINPEDEVLICDPTYMAYYRLASRFGGKLVQAESSDGVSTDLDALYAAITDKTKLIFICNPNNPTGTLLDNTELDAFVAKLPEDVICVIDEAYIDWVSVPDYENAFRFVQDGRKVVVLRTFSKIYGMAGCRVGYAVANKEMTAGLGSIAGSFGTNRIAAAGAAAAMDDKEFLDAAYKNNTEQRAYIMEELENMGVDVIPSNTSFIYFDPHCDTQKCMDYLQANGVYIRYFGEQYLRVSVGLPHQNQLFLTYMKEALASLGALCA